MSISLPPLKAIATQINVPSPAVSDIGEGIRLHYEDRGNGTPIVFVHGSLSDYTYWQQQTEPFAAKYRVIAYSRRYNFPNTNPAQSGYSAIIDSDDLARLVKTLGLGKIVVIGHSYGALTALFFATRHPELLSAMVLAEPPAVSLLNHLSEQRTVEGNAMFQDIQKRMVAPMKDAFARGDRNAGVAAFMKYIFNDPAAWSKMSQSSHDETLRDAHEWDLMMTTGTLFPDLDPAPLQRVSAPVLMFSGTKSYPFLGLIDERVSQLIPVNQRIIFSDSGHQMWLNHPSLCRGYVEAFLEENGIHAAGIRDR
jgi:pimeloyl-ACP methyl ester carboxylesterase